MVAMLLPLATAAMPPLLQPLSRALLQLLPPPLLSLLLGRLVRRAAVLLPLATVSLLLVSVGCFGKPPLKSSLSL